MNVNSMSSLLNISVVNILLILSHLIATQAGQGVAASKRTSTAAAAVATNLPKNDTNGVDEILQETFQLLDTLDERLNQVNNKTKSDNAVRELRSLDDIERDLLAQPSPANHIGAKGPSTSLLIPNLFSKISGQQPVNSDSSQLQDDDQLTHLAQQFSSVRKSSSASSSVAQDGLDSMAPAASSIQAHQTSGSPTSLSSASDRASRQMMTNDEFIGQQANLARFDDSFTEKHIRFSLDLMQAIFASQTHLSKSGPLDSFLISPVSIQQVLMMMHLGARGQTKRELSNSLHFLTSAPATTTSTNISSSAPDAAALSNSTASAHTNKNQKLLRRNPLQKHQQAAASPTSKPSTNQQVLNNNVHEQFGAALRQLLKDSSVSRALTSANQIFLQKDLPLSPQYEWAVKHYYGAELKQVDFRNQAEASSRPTNQTGGSNSNGTGVQQMINDWVERQTRGKLSNFLSSPVATSTLLMALNVLFYKGDWQYKFDPSETDLDAWFTRTDGKAVKMPMMVSKLPLAHAHDPIMKTSVIELPYKAHRLGLFILLPDEVNGIFDTMQSLNSTSFANLISMMRKPSSTGLNEGGINVRLPKFSIDSSPRLSQILSQQLGLKTLFSPDVADLSGMFAGGQSQGAAALQRRSSLVINQTAQSAEMHSQQSAVPQQVGLDEFLHKAVLQVHEQGSVAAAASATIVERVGLFNGQYFEADHPFLVFLMDKQTGLVLFSGLFAGPAQAEPVNSPKQSQLASSTSSANNANSSAHSDVASASGQTMSFKNPKVSS